MSEIRSATVEIRLVDGQVWRVELASASDFPMTAEVNTEREMFDAPLLTEWKTYVGGRLLGDVKLRGVVKEAGRTVPGGGDTP